MNPRCLEKIANGCANEFTWLYKNYRKKIFDYAFLLTADEDASEEIVQDIFVKIWQKRESLLKVEKFNGWLFTIVRNHILDIFHRNKIKEKAMKDPLYIGETCICPDKLHFHKELKLLIKQAAEKLPSQQRLVYLMYRERGMKRDEVAASLKISPNTVKNHDQK